MSDSALILTERIGGIALELGALVLPWIGFVIVYRRLRARSVMNRAGLTGLTAVAAFLVMTVGQFFATCYYPGPPGTGAVARVGKRRADAVAALLTTYQTSEGRYPSTLDALAPTSRLDTLISWFGKATGSPLGYATDSGGRGYRLEFRYTGPGSNRCIRTDSASSWQCSGLF